MPSSKEKPGEVELLRRIRQRAGLGPARADRTGTSQTRELRLGIGDDCAVLRPRAGEEIVVTTDLSLQGRHFRLDWHPPEAVGHRALARGLSDLAAMGARPVAAFLSLALPKELAQSRAESRGGKQSWADRFYDGLLRLAEESKTPLAGGDLAEFPHVVADVVLIGAVRQGRALLRSGARPGDDLYVTGTLGGAVAGLRALEALGGKKPPARLAEALKPHLYPQPRIAQGLWLARHTTATAAMDLSDGLSIDLARLCEESDVTAEVDADALPVAQGASTEDALHGGEDYELLFSARAGAKLPRRIAGIPITKIGRITRKKANHPQVALRTATGSSALQPHGWQHFAHL